MSALKKSGVARVLYGMLVGLQVAMVRGPHTGIPFAVTVAVVIGRYWVMAVARGGDLCSPIPGRWRSLTSTTAAVLGACTDGLGTRLSAQQRAETSGWLMGTATAALVAKPR